ncbi:MAG: DUF4340 domain-containing protein [Bacteroidetes bacterium]|nr:DUF4340 domain-containing protein [Bacteroidota bacterium]
MKKNILLLIILLVAGGITWWVVKHNSGSTIVGELSDFAVEDTSSITKIFMADKQGHSVILKKIDANSWTVNDVYNARPDAIALLLQTITQVEVRSPVGKNAFNNVLKRIAAKGVKVEIYQNDKLVKTYYVGGPSQDQLGTFMYIENSSLPYVTHIPGFNGYLTPRYFTDIFDWRDKRIFTGDTKNISRVIVQSKENLESNYQIDKINDANYSVVDLNTKQTFTPSMDRLSQYLDLFPKVAFEGVAFELTKSTIDSTMEVGWFRKLSVTNNANKTINVEMFKMAFNERSKQVLQEGQPIPIHDRDRFLARIDNDTCFVLAQYILFDRIFRKAAEFQKQ